MCIKSSPTTTSISSSLLKAGVMVSGEWLGGRITLCRRRARNRPKAVCAKKIKCQRCYQFKRDCKSRLNRMAWQNEQRSAFYFDEKVNLILRTKASLT